MDEKKTNQENANELAKIVDEILVSIEWKTRILKQARKDQEWGTYATTVSEMIGLNQALEIVRSHMED